MKKLIITIFLALTLALCSTLYATWPNPHTLHEVVVKGYQVGFVIEDNTILGSDMCMYNIDKDNLIRGWYIAYDLETNLYYYITQDTAIGYVELNK